MSKDSFFEELEDVAVCSYALSEGGVDEIDCVPLALNALHSIATKLGIAIEASHLVEVLHSVRPIHTLSEDEVSMLLYAFRKVLEGRSEFVSMMLRILGVEETLPHTVETALYLYYASLARSTIEQPSTSIVVAEEIQTAIS